MSIPTNPGLSAPTGCVRMSRMRSSPGRCWMASSPTGRSISRRTTLARHGVNSAALAGEPSVLLQTDVRNDDGRNHRPFQLIQVIRLAANLPPQTTNPPVTQAPGCHGVQRHRATFLPVVSQTPGMSVHPTCPSRSQPTPFREALLVGAWGRLRPASHAHRGIDDGHVHGGQGVVHGPPAHEFRE